MYKVFVIEDDIKICNAVIKQIEAWDMVARGVSDFHNILSEFADFSPHIVLMDIALPCFNGYYWCGEIRKLSKVPIIFISSASDNMNMIMAMNMGADDFVAKPFDINVLIAKIQALLRRTYDFSANQTIIEHRGAVLDIGNGTLFFDGNKIELTKNEFRIMLLLMRNRTQTVSREKLMEYLWQTDYFVDENTLTVNINRLRKKLSAAGLDNYIETKFGVGYIIR